jgi:hypothetical protein
MRAEQRLYDGKANGWEKGKGEKGNEARTQALLRKTIVPDIKIERELLWG